MIIITARAIPYGNLLRLLLFVFNKSETVLGYENYTLGTFIIMLDCKNRSYKHTCETY